MMQKNLLWNKLSIIHGRFLCIAKSKAETAIPFGIKLQFGALLAGITAGSAGSLVGLGGAFIALPMLTSARFLALSQSTAHGTSMATVLCTSIGGCYAYSQAAIASSITVENNETNTKGKVNDKISDTKTNGKNVNDTSPINPFFPFNIPSNIGNINLPAAFYLSAPASFTAVLGARMSKRLPTKPLQIGLGIFMICMAPMLHFKEYLTNEKMKNEQLKLNIEAANKSDNDNKAIPSVVATSPVVKPSVELSAKTTTLATTQPVVNIKKDEKVEKLPAPSAPNPFSLSLPQNQNLAILGVGTGILSGVFGVGGGAIIVPALCIFTDLDYKTILGTSLCCMLPVAVTASMTHILQGTMLMACAIPLGVGSLIGSYVGGKLSVYTNESYLRNAFSVVMLLMGLSTLKKALRIIK